MPNYGELWALFFNDVDQLNKVFTPKVIEQSSSSGELFIKNTFNSAFHSFYFLTYGSGNIRVATIIGYDKDSNKAAILTMLPFQTIGKPYFISVSNVFPTDEHTEAFIEGKLWEPLTIMGFEPTFLVTNDKINKNAVNEFQLSAFGYTLFKASNYFMSMDSSELRDALIRLKVDNSTIKRILETEPEGLQFNLSQLNAFVPMVQGTNDYYFLGTITGLSSFSFEHILFYKLDVSIKIDDHNLELPLAIPFDRIEPGYKPNVGDTVIGSLWLQTMLIVSDETKA